MRAKEKWTCLVAHRKWQHWSFNLDLPTSVKGFFSERISYHQWRKHSRVRWGSVCVLKYSYKIELTFHHNFVNWKMWMVFCGDGCLIAEVGDGWHSNILLFKGLPRMILWRLSVVGYLSKVRFVSSNLVVSITSFAHCLLHCQNVQCFLQEK